MDQGNRARQALSVLRKAACRAACLAEAQPDAGWSGVAKVISIGGQGSEVETLNLRAASLQYRPRLVGNQTADASSEADLSTWVPKRASRVMGCLQRVVDGQAWSPGPTRQMAEAGLLQTVLCFLNRRAGWTSRW